jgi:hypothetical protein
MSCLLWKVEQVAIEVTPTPDTIANSTELVVISPSALAVRNGPIQAPTAT